MRLKYRLLLNNLPVLVILTLGLLANLWAWSDSSRRFSEVTGQSVVLVRAGLDMSTLFRDLNLLEFDYGTPHPTLQHNRQRAYRDVDGKVRDVERDFQVLEGSEANPEMRRRLALIRTAFRDFMAVDAQMRQEIAAGRVQEAFDLNFTRSVEDYDRLALVTDPLVAQLRSERTRMQNELWRAQQLYFVLTLAVSLMLVLVLWRISWGSAQRIALPVVALTQDVERFRSGGKSPVTAPEAPCGLTEIDQLRGAFHAMTAEIESLNAIQHATQARLEVQIAERTESLERARQDLEEKVHKLGVLDRMRTNFVNVVSHELRTPLATIMGFAEFLEDELAGPLSAGQRGFLTQIQEAQARLVRLVDDLLDFARLEAGTFRLAKGWTELDSLLEQEVAALTPQASENDISLDFEPSAAPVLARLDRGRIGQVVMNLLNNAIKFTPRGGSVRVRAIAEPKSVRIEVQDSGIGIAPAQQASLFERFFQVDPTTTRSKGGVGLGLSITKAIVEAHGGTMGLNSVPEQGSTFWFSVPLDRPDEKTTAPLSEAVAEL